MKFAPTIISATVTTIMIAAGIFFLVRLTGKPAHEFSAPGEYHFIATKPGEYTLWCATGGTRDGEYFTAEQKIPAGMKIVVTKSGVKVPVHAYDGETESSSGESRRSVLKFTADEPGDYLVSVSGLTEPRVFQISNGSGWLFFLLLMILLGVAPLGAIITLVLLILALTGVYPKRPNKSLEPTPTVVTPPAGQEARRP